MHSSRSICDLDVTTSSRKELRGPYDVMNLGVLFDMSPEHSRAAITTLAEDTVAHGDTRANTFKGIVRLEEVDRTDVVASEAQPMES